MDSTDLVALVLVILAAIWFANQKKQKRAVAKTAKKTKKPQQRVLARRPARVVRGSIGAPTRISEADLVRIIRENPDFFRQVLDAEGRKERGAQWTVG